MLTCEQNGYISPVVLGFVKVGKEIKRGGITQCTHFGRMWAIKTARPCKLFRTRPHFVDPKGDGDCAVGPTNGIIQLVFSCTKVGEES